MAKIRCLHQRIVTNQIPNNGIQKVASDCDYCHQKVIITKWLRLIVIICIRIQFISHFYYLEKNLHVCYKTKIVRPRPRSRPDLQGQDQDRHWPQIGLVIRPRIRPQHWSNTVQIVLDQSCGLRPWSYDKTRFNARNGEWPVHNCATVTHCPLRLQNVLAQLSKVSVQKVKCIQYS